MNVSSAVYDKQLHICIFYFNAFYFSISACYFMNSHDHGLLARVFEACSRVLFAGRRHVDVTVWYQINVDNNGPLWAKKEQLTEVVFLFASRRHGDVTAKVQVLTLKGILDSREVDLFHFLTSLT